MKVTKIYNQALGMCDGMWKALHFGPSHIVWEDENFWDHSIEFCINEMNTETYDNFSDEQLNAVRWSLEQMALMPESERCVEPDDYNGENPDDYPPTCEMAFPGKRGYW